MSGDQNHTTKSRLFTVACLTVVLFGQNALAESPDDTISIGMKRADVLRRLKNVGSAEVFREVTPDAKGWWVESHHECLYLSYRDDVLTGIEVEEKADQPKMYRRWHDAKTYHLR